MADTSSNGGNAIPDWRVVGDWFDVCSCNVPCPCTFAKPPTDNVCDVVFAYRIRTGHYGETSLGGLSVVLLAALEGNVWDGASVDAGMILDAKADPEQQRALELIFTGQAGGWMAHFCSVITNFKGIEFGDISIDIDESLERWNVQIPEVLRASGEALTGPTADPGQRVQTSNPPGSEVGPTNGGLVTWGESIDGRWQAFGFEQDIPKGQNSKHIPFEWSGPDA